MGRRICSERNILICLYLTIFLLPLSSWLFYFALVPAALLSMGAASGDGLAGAF